MQKIVIAMMLAAMSLSSLACDAHDKNEERNTSGQVEEEKFNIKDLMKAMEDA